MVEFSTRTTTTLTTMSTVIALAGTWKRLRCPSQRTVMPDLEIPYRAREPSIVAVFIARMNAAMSSGITKLAPTPIILSSSVT